MLKIYSFITFGRNRIPSQAAFPPKLQTSTVTFSAQIEAVVILVKIPHKLTSQPYVSANGTFHSAFVFLHSVNISADAISANVILVNKFVKISVKTFLEYCAGYAK